MNVNSADEKKGAGHAGDLLISLDQINEFEFRVKFADAPDQDLTIDEPPPIGQGSGPSPTKLLTSAVAGCLSASFLFCARKMRLDVQKLHTDVRMTHARNEKGRLRVGKIEVELSPQLGEPDEQKMQRCLELYEDFCVVTQSVRNGIDISVNVKR